MRAARTLHGFEVGDGPRGTVLLHGFLGSGKNLRTLATRWLALQPDRRFLLLDLTGHGESPVPGEADSLADVAQDVLSTAAARGFGAVEIVGHSLGGRVALHAVAASPSVIRRVTLLDIPPGPIPEAMSDSGSVLQILLRAPSTAPDRAAMRKFFIDERLTPHLADWLLMNLTAAEGGGGVTWRFDRQALARLHTRVNGEDLWPIAERFADRLMEICGARGGYVSEEDVPRFEKLGVPVHTVSSGHFVHVEGLEELLPLLVSGRPA